MTAPARARLALAAVLGFLAVAFGAFAAHGLTDPMVKTLVKTGSEYQLIHALAVFAAFAVERAGSRAAGLAGWLFLAGAVLFPGSLYLLALGGASWAGPLTPIGGVLFLAGWATLAWAAATIKLDCG